MSKFVAGKLPANNYTLIPNHLIRCKAISDGAFRLICWVSSHQEGFEFSFDSIKRIFGYGRDKIRTIIKESEAANYLVRTRINKESGLLDWEYRTFLNPEDAIAYRATIGGKSADGEGRHHVGVNRNMVQPSTAEPVYGSAPPHIKEQYKENQKEKEKKGEENSPSPQISTIAFQPLQEENPESDRPLCLEPLEVEIVEEENLGQSVTNTQQPESMEVVALTATNPSIDQGNAGRENDNQNPRVYSRTVQGFIKLYEEKGILPKNLIEIRQWAKEEVGEYVAKYRKSGAIATTSPDDINPDFLTFLGRGWKDAKLADLLGKLHNLEYSNKSGNGWSPNRWVELKLHVLEWEASKIAGDRTFNIAKQANRYESGTGKYSQFFKTGGNQDAS